MLLLTFFFFFFFFNDTATTEIYTLPLHDALPIRWRGRPENSPRSRSKSPREMTGSQDASPMTSPRCTRSPAILGVVSTRRRVVVWNGLPVGVALEAEGRVPPVGGMPSLTRCSFHSISRSALCSDSHRSTPSPDHALPPPEPMDRAY